METPFKMTIVGMSGCGKTYYLLKMLEKEYFQHFETIYLVCPTFSSNDTYHEWKYINDPSVIVVPCSLEFVEKYLSLVWDLARGTNSLIILDDCASGRLLNKHQSILVRLAMTGRHDGISTIVISQQYTSIAKAFRDQTQKFIIFLPNVDDDIDAVFRHFMKNVDSETLRCIEKTLETKMYARLEIKRTIPRKWELVVPDEINE